MWVVCGIFIADAHGEGKTKTVTLGRGCSWRWPTLREVHAPLSMTGLRGGKNPKRETVVESHPFGFAQRRLLRKGRARMGHPCDKLAQESGETRTVSSCPTGHFVVS